MLISSCTVKLLKVLEIEDPCRPIDIPPIKEYCPHTLNGWEVSSEDFQFSDELNIKSSDKEYDS